MTSTRYCPPWRRSKCAACPIQRVASCSSVRSSHTVSGLASIASSRSTDTVSVVASTLASLLSFGLAPERVEPFVPEAVEELLQLREAFRARLVQAPGAVAPLTHESRLLQDGQVLRDRRPCDVEVRSDLTRRQLVVADERQDPPPSRLCDRLQRRFHDC